MEELSMLWQQISVAGISVAGVSVTGMIGAAVYLIKSMRNIAKEVKGDNFNKELKKDYDAVKKELQETREELAEVVRVNVEKDKKIDLLIDTIAQREGYANEHQI